MMLSRWRRSARASSSALRPKSNRPGAGGLLVVLERERPGRAEIDGLACELERLALDMLALHHDEPHLVVLLEQAGRCQRAHPRPRADVAVADDPHHATESSVIRPCENPLRMIVTSSRGTASRRFGKRFIRATSPTCTSRRARCWPRHMCRPKPKKTCPAAS